jgi:hypothetical protein
MWPSRGRARPPSTCTCQIAGASPRMRPAGSRGVASTPASRSRALATNATAAARNDERTRDERHGLCSVTSTRLGAPSDEHRRDGRHGLCSVTARTTAVHAGHFPSDLPGASRCASISPRTCRALRRAPRCEPRAHDARGHARCGRLVGEHGRRAPAPARSPAPLHECPRQDRGESRARLPHGRAHTRRTPRPLLQTTSALATNATASAPSPLHVSTHQATRADATDATASAP